jgi:hypothetical protein
LRTLFLNNVITAPDPKASVSNAMLYRAEQALYSALRPPPASRVTRPIAAIVTAKLPLSVPVDSLGLPFVAE